MEISAYRNHMCKDKEQDEQKISKDQAIWSLGVDFKIADSSNKVNDIHELRTLGMPYNYHTENAVDESAQLL